MATAGTTARGAAATTGAPAGGAAHGRKDPLGSFGDFLPWILYWVLVGNVAFRLALLIAVLVSVGLLLVRRATGQPWRTLGIGSVVVFVVLLLLSLVVDDGFLERWLQPLSNLGLLLIVGILTRAAAIMAGLLMIAFIAAVSSAAARGLSIDCGCFGGGGQVAPGQTAYTEEIVRDIGLLLMAGWLVWRPRSRLALDHEDIDHDETETEGVGK